MAAAAASTVGQAVLGQALKTGGEVVKDGSKTIFGAIGNLINEKYEKRKAQYEAAINLDKIKLAGQLEQHLVMLKGQLDKDLMNVRSEEERRVIFQKFENEKELFLLKWNKELELKKEEWNRKDKELEREYELQDRDYDTKQKNIEDVKEIRDELKHLIYTADQKDKIELAKVLASTARGDSKILEYTARGNTEEDSIIHRVNNPLYNKAQYTKKIYDSLETSNGMTELEKYLSRKDTILPTIPPAATRIDIPEPMYKTREQLIPNLDEETYEKFFTKGKHRKTKTNIF